MEKEHKHASKETKHDAQKDTQTQTTAPVKTVGSKTFFIALGLFVIVLAGLLLVPRFFEQDPQTLSDLHTDNLLSDDTEDAYVYNGYSFVYYDGLWYTQIFNQFTGALYDIPLHYGPREVSDVVVTGDFNNYFMSLTNNNIANYTMQTYLTFDPTDEQMGYVALATGELTQNLAQTFGVAFIPGCTEEGVGCESAPIITCENTDDPVLYLRSGSPTMVYAEGNCITIQGEGFELVRAADRFLLKLYNVMI